MNKKWILLLFIPLLFAQCNVKKEPEFIGVEQVKLLERSPRSLTFEILLNFNNPNLLGGTFSSEDLTVSINNFKLTSLRSPIFEVPASDEFTMPIIAKLDAQSFKGRELEILGTLVNIATSKSIDLKIEGDLDYKIVGYSSSYKVNYSDSIELK